MHPPSTFPSACDPSRLPLSPKSAEAHLVAEGVALDLFASKSFPFVHIHRPFCVVGQMV